MDIRKLTLASIAATGLVVATAPARAAEVKAGDLVISQAWARATPKGAKIGGGYLTIENKGTTADKLLGGSTDVAGRVQVHEMSMQNGIMKMRPLEGGLTIDPGKPRARAAMPSWARSLVMKAGSSPYGKAAWCLTLHTLARDGNSQHPIVAIG